MDRLDEVTKDCFNALIQIRQLDPASQPPPDVLHQRMRFYIDQMVTKATEKGYQREDAQDMAYAICALVDETAQGNPGPIRQYWMTRPLQLHYFNENVAGERFFERLQYLRQNPQKVDVLRVYYLCLMFGFQGRYRIRGGEVELQQLTEAVEQDLQRARVFGSEPLSPHGDRPKEQRAAASREMPWIWLSVGAIVIALALYVGLRVTLGSTTDSVVQRVDSLNRP